VYISLYIRFDVASLAFPESHVCEIGITTLQTIHLKDVSC